MTTRSGPNTAAESVEQLITHLRATHGIEFVKVRRLVCRLAAGEARDLAALIESVPASRQWVLEVLRELEPTLETAGDRYRLREPHSRLLAEAAGCALLPQPFGDRIEAAAPVEPSLLAAIGRHRMGLPSSLWRLDHVPATARTIARRATFLAHSFDLADRHVVCLGDHDLTSVALTTLQPGVHATVVDVDEHVLDHVASIAAAHRLSIRCVFADLRVELPSSLTESADLVFTDPPYTPPAAELFLARSLAALRRTAPGRVLFCYGHSERQVKQGLEVQKVLGRLGLAVEAVLPDFNRYEGADAIGRSSALWVCEPTKRSWSALRGYQPRDARIYSRGRDAEEAVSTETAGFDPQRLAVRATDLAGVKAGLLDRFGPVMTPEQVVGTDSLLGHQGPPQRGRPMLVNLGEQFGEYALRLLLRSPAAETVVLLASRRTLQQTGLLDADDMVRRFLSARYSIGADVREPPAMLVACWTDPPKASWSLVARYVLDHPQARVLHAWREGLIRLAAECGLSLTKNQARALIEATGLVAPLGDSYLGELPLSELRRLVESLMKTAQQVCEGIRPEA